MYLPTVFRTEPCGTTRILYFCAPRVTRLGGKRWQDCTTLGNTVLLHLPPGSAMMFKVPSSGHVEILLQNILGIGFSWDLCRKKKSSLKGVILLQQLNSKVQRDLSFIKYLSLSLSAESVL